MIQSRKLVPWAITLASCAGGLANAQPVNYDFNGDGYGDFPVSITGLDTTDPVTGVVRIWSGASKTVLTTIAATDTDSLYGWSYASAGDLNADGKADLIVGEPLWDGDGNLTGRVMVYSGADSSVLFDIVGTYANSGFGRTVTGVQDWNGDGTPDLAVSSWDIVDTDGNGIGDDSIGRVEIISGSNGRVLTEIFEPAAGEWFGYGVFGLGDINGDGFADIAITDPRHESSPGSGVYGAVYIFHGGQYLPYLGTSNAAQSIINTDSNLRTFASQVDTMHPDLWLDQPTLQIISLTQTGTKGPNDSEIEINIHKVNGTVSGTKGTRTSLKLAGDINLDGKVNAADIQDSISQLGTNPQATGVMPIADSNGDSIIDMADIQVVIDGYGQATDIYEGLWDGERLLSIPASAAGFGSTAGIGPIGGSGGNSGPGPRPSDCDDVKIIDLNTHLSTLTPLPWLLRQEVQTNCNECPDFEDNPGCYACETPESVSGGEISANPEQPDVGQSVTFTVSGVSESPGTLECVDSCGGDKTAQTEIDEIPLENYRWRSYTKHPDDGWPEEVDPNELGSGVLSWPSGLTYTMSGGATCQEKKAVCWAKATDCAPDWQRVGEKVVKFADFNIKVDPVNDSAQYVISNSNKPGYMPGEEDNRTVLGVFEPFYVRAFDENDNPVVVDWSVELVGGNSSNLPSGPSFGTTASQRSGQYIFTATSGSCERSVTIDVIEPKLDYGGPSNEYTGMHTQGNANNGICSVVYAYPLTVSFQGVVMAETLGTFHATGDFYVAINNGLHCSDFDDSITPAGICDERFMLNNVNQAVSFPFGGIVVRDSASSGNAAPAQVGGDYDDSSVIYMTYRAAYKQPGMAGDWFVSSATGSTILNVHWMADIFGRVCSYKGGLFTHSQVDDDSAMCN